MGRGFREYDPERRVPVTATFGWGPWKKTRKLEPTAEDLRNLGSTGILECGDTTIKPGGEAWLSDGGKLFVGTWSED